MAMPDQKHFSYDATINLGSLDNERADKSQVEILDVAFLTPARVKGQFNGAYSELEVNVDFINRKVYEGAEECTFSDQIFQYLDQINSLPEDFFQASEEVYGQAQEAKAEHDQINRNMVFE